MFQRRSAPASAASTNNSFIRALSIGTIFDPIRTKIPALSPSINENRRRSQENSGGLLSFLGLRRQGRRIRDDGSGDDEDQLLVGIHALQATGKMAVKTADFQRKAANAFSKWAKGTNNNAMADVIGRTSELLGMSAEREIKFAEEYEKSLKQLQKRLDETMKRVKREKKEWDKCVALECSLQRTVRVSDSHQLRVKLAEAILEREEAERKLTHERVEAEVSRIYGLQDGLKKIADAQWNLAKQMKMISACQRELVEFVPTISNRDICQMNYTCRAETRQRVAQLRRSLESTHQNQMPTNPPANIQNRERNQRSQTHPPPLPITLNNSRHDQHNNQRRRRFRDPVPPPPLPSFSQLGFPRSPPPAYTPTAPPIELVTSVAGTPRVARNNPNRHSTGADGFLVNHSPTTSLGTIQPAADSLYPKLGINPFAESLEIGRRSQRETQERSTATGWLGGQQ